MAPSYFKPASVQDLIDFCAPIAAEADPLPFYFYDIPGMTGVRLRMSEFLYQARFRIPTLRGLKYSNDDLLELQECVRLDHGAFDVLLGSDECLLAGLCLGIRGAVGSTYNFAAPLYQRLIKAFEKHDLETARALQGQSIDLIKTLGEFGFLAASKCVMAMLGVECGPVRPPVRNLTLDQRLALGAALRSVCVSATAEAASLKPCTNPEVPHGGSHSGFRGEGSARRPFRRLGFAQLAPSPCQLSRQSAGGVPTPREWAQLAGRPAPTNTCHRGLWPPFSPEDKS